MLAAAYRSNADGTSSVRILSKLSIYTVLASFYHTAAKTIARAVRKLYRSISRTEERRKATTVETRVSCCFATNDLAEIIYLANTVQIFGSRRISFVKSMVEEKFHTIETKLSGVDRATARQRFAHACVFWSIVLVPRSCTTSHAYSRHT